MLQEERRRSLACVVVLSIGSIEKSGRRLIAVMVDGGVWYGCVENVTYIKGVRSARVVPACLLDTS